MFVPTPVSIAKQQLIQRCVSDGRRIGIGIPFVEGLSGRLCHELSAAWCAPRRMWVVKQTSPQLLAARLNNIFRASATYDLSDLEQNISSFISTCSLNFFAEVLDVQIFKLTDGNLAISSHFDSLVVSSMKDLRGVFHKFAKAWVVTANLDDVLTALRTVAGIDPEFIFIHDKPFILENLGGVDKPVSPLKVPCAPPPNSGCVSDGKMGTGFLSFHDTAAEKVLYDEEALTQIALEANLRDYQVSGVKFLIRRTCGLLGDDMGLGKTRQSIVAGRLAAGREPTDRVLILCPASLKLNWEREIKSVFPKAQIGMVGEDRLSTLFSCQWVIANYDRLGSLVKEPALGFKVMLVDEAHYLKEHDAGRTRNAFVMAGRISRRFLITGTPMLNRIVELHTLLRLSGHHLGEMALSEFRAKFSGSKERNSKLAKALCTWMIRRRKDVLEGFGKKFRQLRYISPAEGLNQYGAILRNMSLGAMPKIVKLRQCLESLKIEFVVETILGLGFDDKVIVFVEFMATVESIKRALSAEGVSHVSLVGSDNNSARQRAVDEFQANPNCRVFITTRSAGGVDITLVAANYVVFASLPWNPALLRQAEDRAYRLGQIRDVYVLIPLIPKTIDDDIWEMLGSKRILEEDVIESAASEEDDGEAVNRLAKRFEVEKIAAFRGA